jgi:uncharacterized protein YcbX
VTAGTVNGLFRWPVKSFRGEVRDHLDLDPRGVPGDRAHAVWLKGGKRATARLVPGLLRWAATYPSQVNGTIPVPHVTAPDGTPYVWGDPELPHALSEDLGREVDVVHDAQGMQDLPNSILITFEATRTGLEDELDEPVDLRRFRTNVHLQLDAPAFAEAAWEGRRMRIGDATVELLHPCLRCTMVARDPDTNAKSPRVLKHLIRDHGAIFGINARPLGTATIRPGDPVSLEEHT